MSKKLIADDLKRVASKLKRTPSRDEYRKLGKFSEHRVKEAFEGSFTNALTAAGLTPKAARVTNVLEAEGFEIAQLRNKVESQTKFITELSQEHLSTDVLRQMIGSKDCTTMCEKADWLKGPRTLTNGLTGTPTLFLSDLHFDEVVKPEQVNYMNEYDHEIAVRRIKHTIQTAVDMLKLYMLKPKYDGFVLALGGDMFSGNIHEELAESNYQTILRSVLDLRDILVPAIRQLADEFGKVFVPAVVGNHGRMHKKPRYKSGVEQNFEWLLYQLLQREFIKDDRVAFLIPDSFDAQWTLYNLTYNLNHGDQFKGGSGISGIFPPLMLGMARKSKRQDAIGQPFQVMMNGHWHQYIHTNSLIVNGTPKGYDEFAFRHNFNYEPPQQALFVTHPTKGMNWRLPILCDNIPYLQKKIKNRLSW